MKKCSLGVPSPLCILDLVPPDFNDNIALLYSSSDHYVQPEDGLNVRGRNM